MRSIKRLALVALFALPMGLTGCEKLGDATGPEMSKIQGPSALRANVVVSDSTKTKEPEPSSSGFDIGWPD